MRSGPLVLCAAAVMLFTAWSAPQILAGKKQKVNIIFRCETTGGASVIVSPWRRQLYARTDSIEWSLVTPGLPGSGPDNVVIMPKAVSPWPFTSPVPVIVTTSMPGLAWGVPPSVPNRTYKYSITGICHVGGVVDTVTIDPDMIIPT